MDLWLIEDNEYILPMSLTLPLDSRTHVDRIRLNEINLQVLRVVIDARYQEDLIELHPIYQHTDLLFARLKYIEGYGIIPPSEDLTNYMYIFIQNQYRSLIGDFTELTTDNLYQVTSSLIALAATKWVLMVTEPIFVETLAANLLHEITGADSFLCSLIIQLLSRLDYANLSTNYWTQSIYEAGFEVQGEVFQDYDLTPLMHVIRSPLDPRSGRTHKARIALYVAFNIKSHPSLQIYLQTTRLEKYIWRVSQMPTLLYFNNREEFQRITQIPFVRLAIAAIDENFDG